MIGLSEMFNMVDMDTCVDPATSLRNMGTDLDLNLSIPIYEIFYLKLLPGGDTGFLCDNIIEYNMLRKLCVQCGAVACCINLLDMDILTLFGLLCVCTPNTGFTVFYKNNVPAITEMTEEIAEQLCELAGIPYDPNYGALDFANQALDFLINKCMENVNDDLQSKGINIMPWDDIPEFTEQVTQTGEAHRMYMYRKNTKAQVL